MLFCVQKGLFYYPTYRYFILPTFQYLSDSAFVLAEIIPQQLSSLILQTARSQVFDKVGIIEIALARKTNKEQSWEIAAGKSSHFGLVIRRERTENS